MANYCRAVTKNLRGTPALFRPLFLYSFILGHFPALFLVVLLSNFIPAISSFIPSFVTVQLYSWPCCCSALFPAISILFPAVLLYSFITSHLFAVGGLFIAVNNSHLFAVCGLFINVKTIIIFFCCSAQPSENGATWKTPSSA